VVELLGASTVLPIVTQFGVIPSVRGEFRERDVPGDSVKPWTQFPDLGT
jgi:hypothetical protein